MLVADKLWLVLPNRLYCLIRIQFLFTKVINLIDGEPYSSTSVRNVESTYVLLRIPYWGPNVCAWVLRDSIYSSDNSIDRHTVRLSPATNGSLGCD